MDHISTVLEGITKESQANTQQAKKSTDETEWMDWQCDVCRDAGFVHPIGANGKPLYDQVVPCPACGGCLGEETPMTFENFDAGIRGVQDALKAASDMAIGGSDFINELGEESKLAWLVIAGIHGCGKTHLAKAVGTELTKRGKQVNYWYVPNLLAEMRKGMNLDEYPHTMPIETLVDSISYCEFLILDDLGAEHLTQWTGARIEEVINRRYQANKKLLVTTNVNVTTLPEPILSRFRDRSKCSIVTNRAIDHRKTKR